MDVMNLDQKQLIGWREWVSLPNLGLSRIKAKIDTGARTSALHAFEIELFEENNIQKVAFSIHPIQNNSEVIVQCKADVIDTRFVTDSGGHREERYIIKTLLIIGDISKEVEITLTNRDSMRFRMLLGRTTLTPQFIINPAASYLMSKKKIQASSSK